MCLAVLFPARWLLDFPVRPRDTRNMSFAIHEHLIQGIRFRCSPFADARPEGARPELIVVHNISLPPGEFGGSHVEDLFTGRLDRNAHPYFAEIHHLEVSAHLFVKRSGELVQFVPFDQRAWHAGVSCWQGRERCNDFSIGIEVEGTDETPYEPVQYDVLAELILLLRTRYPGIGEHALTGHCDIAPGRKTDPGPAFDWAGLHERLVRRGNPA